MSEEVAEREGEGGGEQRGATEAEWLDGRPGAGPVRGGVQDSSFSDAQWGI